MTESHWFLSLWQGESIAHAVFMLSLVIATGLILGSVRIRGISLGIAGILFTGLIAGHFQVSINSEILEFAREFGLMLFVYAIGLQVGPGLMAAFRREGFLINFLASAVVVGDILVAALLIVFLKLGLPEGIGILSGATTNTPSLAAATQILADSARFAPEAIRDLNLGYAAAYPFGILGIIIVMGIVQAAFRINIPHETAAFAQSQTIPPLSRMNLEVTNPNLDGLAVAQIPSAQDGIIISRVCHDGKISVAAADSVIHVGDVLLAVGPTEKLERLRVVVGRMSEMDLRALPSDITSRKIVVTRVGAVGKTVDELHLVERYGVTITRITRADMSFTPGPNVRLQMADTVLVVGESEAIAQAAAVLGNSMRQLNHPQLVPVFLGLVFGIILGSIPIEIPGVPGVVRLGLAGGPLIAAIILSRIQRIGSFVWYLPMSANYMIREVGIALFLACVGLRSGGKLVETFVHGNGLLWMVSGATITLVPLLIVGVAARIFFKTNFASLSGLLAGSMTDPPALAYANTLTRSDIPTVSYATVYPLVMILRIVSVQIMALLFLR